VQKLRRFIHRFKSTDELLITLKTAPNATAHIILEILKERECHQNETFCGQDWTGVNFQRATFAKAHLRGVLWQGANLRDSYFYDADLQDSQLISAHLHHANLREAHLQGACLDNCQLTYANLARADLRGCRLLKADLSFANLWRTQLQGANLTGAILHQATIEDVLGDPNTILPNGEAWSPSVDWHVFTQA
jgi:uncharacterized protein YjbI with pentapeptide repeats